MPRTRRHRESSLHRTQEAGLGAAYVAGFARVLSEGYDVLVEVDADGSHDPVQLPRLLAALGGPEGADLDVAWRTLRAGFRLVEVPIVFTEREHGESKMDGSIVKEALWRVTAWGIEQRWARARALLGASRSNRRA